ncbi:MAG: alkaline phosphatase family protein [Phycisphaerales bacterium]|nr:alkaline phosphatase family protein [Hyphomonadaceae bacterium]
MRRILTALAALAVSAGLVPMAASAQTPQPHVVLVTIDGVRWEDLFRGADPALVVDEAYRARYVDTPARPAALAPFLLSFAEHGALIGNRDAGSCARVANDFWFSYPGYAEILAGRPNPRVRYNEAVPNDDVTVLERLARRPDFANQVRVFAAWDATPAIVNSARSSIPVFLPPTQDQPYDDHVMGAVREAYANPPRVTWIAFGDPDSYAHAGAYEAYLNAITEADAFLQALWASIESDPRTAGHTTLIVTTDHGRGVSERNRWRGHGSGRWRGIIVPGLRREGSDAVFIAARGPGIAGAGAYNMENCATLGQVAPTLLASLGLLAEEGQSDMAAPLAVFAPPSN